MHGEDEKDKQRRKRLPASCCLSGFDHRIALFAGDVQANFLIIAAKFKGSAAKPLRCCHGTLHDREFFHAPDAHICFRPCSVSTICYTFRSNRNAPRPRVNPRCAAGASTVAVGLRLILLFVVMRAIESFETPLFEIHWSKFIACEMTLHALIVLAGGAFIIYYGLPRDCTHARNRRPRARCR